MKFNHKKSTQLLNFFIRNSDSKFLSKLELLKLTFLADRYHLRKYARLITEDDYLAMSYGPVASSVKDITEFSDFLSPEEKSYASKFLDKAYKHDIKSVADIDFSVFSQTDIEALNKVIEIRRKVGDLVKYTHKFPEWKKHEAALSMGYYNRKNMDILDFFSETSPEYEYCDVTKELLLLNKEHFIENEKLVQFWG